MRGLPLWYPILRSSHCNTSKDLLCMMTSSNGKIFRVTGPLCGEFTGHRWVPAQRPVARCFDVVFDLRLNELLNKQPSGWWFETPSRSLWRHCNGCPIFKGVAKMWLVSSRIIAPAMAVGRISLLLTPPPPYCQLCPWGDVSVEFQSKFKHFHLKKFSWKCRLWNDCHFLGLNVLIA